MGMAAGLWNNEAYREPDGEFCRPRNGNKRL